jgi:hypothetical protein
VLIVYSIPPGIALSSDTLQLFGNARLRSVAVPVALCFARNHGHTRKSWNIFFAPAFLVTVVGIGDRPHARRLG